MNKLSYKRHNVTDDEWNTIKWYLPGQEGKPWRIAKDKETIEDLWFMNEIVWILETGFS